MIPAFSCAIGSHLHLRLALPNTGQGADPHRLKFPLDMRLHVVGFDQDPDNRAVAQRSLEVEIETH